MPVFVCEACNETLKRAKVQAHAASCRGCWVMSCMDCNRKFEGDDYWEHTSCVTEAERYQGHLYVHKDNKGDVKQQAWLSNVQAKLDCAPSSERLKPFLSALLKYDNIPRKKPKFLNFAKNSLNLKADREGIAAQLWDVIGFDSAPKEAAANGGSPHLEKSAETHKQPNVEQPAKPATAKREGLKGERQQPSSEEPPGLSKAEREGLKGERQQPSSEEPPGLSKAEREGLKSERQQPSSEEPPGLSKAERKGLKSERQQPSSEETPGLSKAERKGLKSERQQPSSEEPPGLSKAERKGLKSERQQPSSEETPGLSKAERKGLKRERQQPSSEETPGLSKAERKGLKSERQQPSSEEPPGLSKAERKGLKSERQQPSSEETPGRASDAKPQGRKRKVELQEGEEKPIKWKKIIAKELKSCGGRMNLKELRKACVAEALAHPSHRNRQGGQVRREFDEQLSTFHKFKVDGNQITLQATNED